MIGDGKLNICVDQETLDKSHYGRKYLKLANQVSKRRFRGCTLKSTSGPIIEDFRIGFTNCVQNIMMGKIPPKFGRVWEDAP